ncbi:EamA-like transporter family protein [Thiothrix caldifontis]|uniref:EamA-like transporter family protein n=1 Tax=Thiothrix caldifontis TaxID=525918 RepID=A0A1H4GR23_9GAMM|nr:DMT family transporter [Thiothrix caldifontis]SEB11268.1 EamA-like transporter family protein [Thiothrix caldifontis]
MNTKPLLPLSGLAYGALLILASEFFLVSAGMVIKHLNGVVSTEQTVFFRNAFALLLLLPWLWRNGLQAVKTDCLHLHFLRSLLGVTAMSCMFYAWGHLPLAQSALLKQTMPLFVPIVAFFWVGERLSWRNFVAIGFGFVGVLLVLNPFQEAAVFNLAVVLGLFGAVMGGSTKVSIRRMRSSEEPALRVVFYFALFASVLSVIPAVLAWLPLTGETLLWLFLLGVLATLAQWSLTAAYGHAPAGQLGAFTYASVIFAAVLGWWWWDESLSLLAIAGIGTIIAAGLLVMLGQARLPVARLVEDGA